MSRNSDMKHLFRRGGVWWVVVMRDGKRHRETTGETALNKARERRDELLAVYLHRDKAEAVAALQGKIDHHLAIARKLEEASKPGIPFPQMWTRWTDTAPTASPATLRQYEVQLDLFRRWVVKHHPETTMEQLTPEMCSAFVRHLEGEGRTANTTNKYVGLLRQVWSAILPELPNPWNKIERRKGEAVSRRPLTKEELATVLGSCDDELRVLVLLGALLALRLGDACTLRWSAVDLQRGIIQVIPRKTRSRTGRTLALPIVGALKNALEKRERGKPGDYVLPRVATDFLRHPTYVTDRLQKLFTDAGIETLADRERGGRRAVSVGFHSLRHFAATMMMEGNVPQAVAQAMLGHASPALLATYQHVGAGQIQSAVKQIAAQADGTATGSESDADKLAMFRKLAETMTAKNWRAVKAELLAIE